MSFLKHFPQVFLHPLPHLFPNFNSIFLQVDSQSTSLLKAQDAQIISICHASPPQPHSQYPDDCTNPHFRFFNDPPPHIRLTIITIIRSAQSRLCMQIFRFYNPDFQPSLPMFQSHMSKHFNRSLNSRSVFQSVLNSAARLVLNIPKFRHISAAIRDELHWLPIRRRIDFKIALMVCYCCAGIPDGTGPSCWLSRRQCLRSASRGDLVVPRFRLQTFGHRPFAVSGPQILNSLPLRIRQVFYTTTTTTTIFHKHEIFTLFKTYTYIPCIRLNYSNFNSMH